MKHFIGFTICILALTSCGREKGELLEFSSNGDSGVLVVGGQDGNHRGVTMYDLSGNFIRAVDFRSELATPRGLVPYDDSSFLVSLDSTDSIFHVTLEGVKSQFHGSAQFNGTQYDIAKSPAGLYYAIESNRIEVFDEDGVRLPTHYITNIVDGCTLNNPRGIHFRQDGRMVVTDGTGNEVFVYDVSNPTPVCESAVAFADTPHGVVEHSDGSLYITTQADHQVYRTDPDGGNRTLIWTADITIIRTPTDIIELPNGNLLIASSVTDTIEEITTAGERVGTTPFIIDSHSLNPSSLTIVGGSE